MTITIGKLITALEEAVTEGATKEGLTYDTPIKFCMGVPHENDSTFLDPAHIGVATRRHDNGKEFFLQLEKAQPPIADLLKMFREAMGDDVINDAVEHALEQTAKDTGKPVDQLRKELDLGTESINYNTETKGNA